MLTYTKIGKKGHLGNQLFQIASTIGLAVANKQDFAFLDWKYQKYFKNKLPLLTLELSSFINAEEKEYNFHQWNLETGAYDLSGGWFQTEKYFDSVLTKHYFEFSDALINRLKILYEGTFNKRTILLSIRRGDFVNHPDYFQLPINYYLNSLAQFFPDWESCNLIVLSDDIKYCKFHFSFLKNAFFGTGLNEIEQLCLGSLCDDFIISNSTFSWWTAWLGEKNGSKVIRPFKNFDGLKSKEFNDKDYFPERWKAYNHLGEKIYLENTIIALKKPDKIIEDYLKVNFSFDNENELFYWSQLKENKIEIKSNLVLINNCIIPPFCIYESINNIKKQKVNSVYFLLGKFIFISRFLDYTVFNKQFDFGIFTKIMNASLHKDKSEMVFISFNKNEAKILNNIEKFDIGKHLDFNIHFTHAGKIKNIFGNKYFLKKKRELFIKSIKRAAKRLLKLK